MNGFVFLKEIKGCFVFLSTYTDLKNKNEFYLSFYNSFIDSGLFNNDDTLLILEINNKKLDILVFNYSNNVLKDPIQIITNDFIIEILSYINSKRKVELLCYDWYKFLKLVSRDIEYNDILMGKLLYLNITENYEYWWNDL